MKAFLFVCNTIVTRSDFTIFSNKKFFSFLIFHFYRNIDVNNMILHLVLINNLIFKHFRNYKTTKVFLSFVFLYSVIFSTFSKKCKYTTTKVNKDVLIQPCC